MDKNPGTWSQWFQAHVFVEEALKVETWWGYSVIFEWNDEDIEKEGTYGYDFWRYEKREPFTPKLGSDTLPDEAR